MENILMAARPILVTTPQRWIHLIETLPTEVLTTPAASGEWSAIDCLQHLVDTERWVFPVRIDALKTGTLFPAYDPDSEGSKSPTSDSLLDLVADFARLRNASLSAFDRINPSELELTGNHPELGPVTLSELIHEWAGHDLMHTVQAERAIMQPFIMGCGPWRSYFTDHIAVSRS
jgi:hypothetical protein